LAAGFLFPGSIMKDSAASKNFSVDFRVSGIWGFSDLRCFGMIFKGIGEFCFR